MEIWNTPVSRYYDGWYDIPSGPVGPPATDGQIKAEAVDRLRKNPKTAESELSVDVKRAVVILRGTVPDRRAKRAAGDDCWDIMGVHDVSNQLEVADGPSTRGTVGDAMTAPAVMAFSTDSVATVAALMRDRDIGFVVVVDESGEPMGVVTDRDIVTRSLATGAGADTSIGSLVTADYVSIDSERPLSDAVMLMRSYALRRLAVVHGGSVVGVVSLGDLARERDPGSALADIATVANRTAAPAR
jgi:CBS domain-containing protein